MSELLVEEQLLMHRPKWGLRIALQSLLYSPVLITRFTPSDDQTPARANYFKVDGHQYRIKISVFYPQSAATSRCRDHDREENRITTKPLKEVPCMQEHLLELQSSRLKSERQPQLI